MDENLSRAEFLAHVQPIREDIAEIIKLQREQNGRVAVAETKIAVLEERNPKRDATVVSGLVSGLINGLALWFTQHR